jgi:20S proteasome subunit beta 2
MLSGSTPLPEKLGLGGFSFDLARRNAVLEVRGMVAPKPKKTGTTIVGVIFDGGVVLGADTRATEGDTVADKNCEKIHYIADNIWCCGAGTSADTESTTGLIASQLELHRMATGKQPRVVTACTMLKRMLYRYQGHVSAALVLGGVDCKGPHLYTVYPHGSTDSLPYVTMGSGSLAAMAVFESEFKSKMTEEEAKKLVRCLPPRHSLSTSSLPCSFASTPFAPSPFPLAPSCAIFSSSPTPLRSSLAPLPLPPAPRASPSSGALSHHGGH